jgi:hypothetical protein
VDRPKKNRNTILRQLVFLAGLAALFGSAAAYVWIQAPLGVAITLERDLAKKVGRIMTLDEVLTMSAKMAASSGEVAYEQRYNDHVEELDRLIKETVGMSTDPAVRAAAQSTDEANRRLVDMETRSFELNKQRAHCRRKPAWTRCPDSCCSDHKRCRWISSRSRVMPGATACSSSWPTSRRSWNESASRASSAT